MNDEPTTTPILTSRLYDALKYIAQILLPALGALYFGLAQIWGFPKAEEVIGTIAVVDTFLGVLLRISSNSYNKSDAKFDGSIDIEEQDDKKVFSLNLKSDPEELPKKSEVLFKVKAS